MESDVMEKILVHHLTSTYARIQLDFSSNCFTFGYLTLQVSLPNT